jgi:hypothetical protein
MAEIGASGFSTKLLSSLKLPHTKTAAFHLGKPPSPSEARMRDSRRTYAPRVAKPILELDRQVSGLVARDFHADADFFNDWGNPVHSHLLKASLFSLRLL